MTPYRQTWQADIGLGKQVDVQGIAIQTDILQVTANKVAIMVVTEGVIMQRLDVVILIGVQEIYCLLLLYSIFVEG